MKSPTLSSGIFLSIAACALAFPVLFVLTPWIGYYIGMKVLGSVLLALYVVYLISNSKSKAGIVVFLSAALAAMAFCLFFPIALTTMIFIFVTILWLARTALFQKNLAGGFLDLVLIVIGFSFSWFAWVSTQSLLVALWTFFLSQTAFVLIPELFGPQKDATAAPDDFHRAHQAAENAIARLITK